MSRWTARANQFLNDNAMRLRDEEADLLRVIRLAKLLELVASEERERIENERVIEREREES